MNVAKHIALYMWDHREFPIHKKIIELSNFFDNNDKHVKIKFRKIPSRNPNEIAKRTIGFHRLHLSMIDGYGYFDILDEEGEFCEEWIEMRSKTLCAQAIGRRVFRELKPLLVGKFVNRFIPTRVNPRVVR